MPLDGLGGTGLCTFSSCMRVCQRIACMVGPKRVPHIPPSPTLYLSSAYKHTTGANGFGWIDTASLPAAASCETKGRSVSLASSRLSRTVDSTAGLDLTWGVQFSTAEPPVLIARPPATATSACMYPDRPCTYDIPTACQHIHTSPTDWVSAQRCTRSRHHTQAINPKSSVSQHAACA